MSMHSKELLWLFGQMIFSLAFWVGSHSLTLEKKSSLLFCVRTPSFSLGNRGMEFLWPFRQELYREIIKQDSLLASLRSLISLTNAMGNSPSTFPADYMPHHYGINSVQYLQKMAKFYYRQLRISMASWGKHGISPYWPINDLFLPITWPPSSFFLFMTCKLPFSSLESFDLSVPR